MLGVDGSYPRLGVVTCTCNPATLEAEFRNGMGSTNNTSWGLATNKQSFDRWVDCVTTCNPALGEEPD